VEETLTVNRLTRAMPVYQFVLAMLLALYVGFSRLNHLRFLEREPMLTGILKVLRLPPQCTFCPRFLFVHTTLRTSQTTRQITIIVPSNPNPSILFLLLTPISVNSFQGMRRAERRLAGDSTAVFSQTPKRRTLMRWEGAGW